MDNISELIEQINIKDEVLNSENFKFSAVLVPFVKLDGKIKILFEKRSINIPQPGEICFPGGKYDGELDKNFEDTAIRETSEELGIDKEKIKIIKQIPKLVNPTSVVVEIFLGEIKIDTLDEINISKDEVEKLIVVELDWLINNEPKEYEIVSEVKHTIREKESNKMLPIEELGFNDSYKKPWGRKFHKTYVYKYDGEVIWGLTAHIVNKVIKGLKD